MAFITALVFEGSHFDLLLLFPIKLEVSQRLVTRRGTGRVNCGVSGRQLVMPCCTADHEAKWRIRCEAKIPLTRKCELLSDEQIFVGATHNPRVLLLVVTTHIHQAPPARRDGGGGGGGARATPTVWAAAKPAADHCRPQMMTSCTECTQSTNNYLSVCCLSLSPAWLTSV